jgi:hypothetical protein
MVGFPNTSQLMIPLSPVILIQCYLISAANVTLLNKLLH